MSKTKTGESGIDPKEIDEIGTEEYKTIAELVDYLRWRFTTKLEEHYEIVLFFSYFHSECASYDQPVPEHLGSILSHEVYHLWEAAGADLADNDRAIELAQHLAKVVDRHVFMEKLNRIEDKLDALE